MAHDFLTTVESHYFAIPFYLFIYFPQSDADSAIISYDAKLQCFDFIQCFVSQVNLKKQ